MITSTPTTLPRYLLAHQTLNFVLFSPFLSVYLSLITHNAHWVLPIIAWMWGYPLGHKESTSVHMPKSWFSLPQQLPAPKNSLVRNGSPPIPPPTCAIISADLPCGSLVQVITAVEINEHNNSHGMSKRQYFLPSTPRHPPVFPSFLPSRPQPPWALAERLINCNI